MTIRNYLKTFIKTINKQPKGVQLKTEEDLLKAKEDLFRESWAKARNRVAQAKLDYPNLAKWPGFLPKEYRPIFEELFNTGYEFGKKSSKNS